MSDVCLIELGEDDGIWDIHNLIIRHIGDTHKIKSVVVIYE